MNFNFSDLAWEKMQGLIPAIVQDAKTSAVLMMGYMDQAALQKTIETGWITFYSRSKKQQWVKGETSGNKLQLVTIFPDCDKDTLLISAIPTGPTCHAGTNSCFSEVDTDWKFIQDLEKIILERQQFRPENSYTSELFNEGISRIAQKVGEESIEVILASLEKDEKQFCNEVADLFFHVLVLLRAKGLSLSEVITILKNRR